MAAESIMFKLCAGLSFDPLPENVGRSSELPHAPKRRTPLDNHEKKIALQNALRYFPAKCHKILAPEFAQELSAYGHIYMYRFKPQQSLSAPPVANIPAKCGDSAAIILMILNNLDPRVAQFPEELVTYGGNGQVFSNWAQFRLTLHYLSIMTEHQTLVMYSGHPLGLFPSQPDGPRVVITNGMMIPNYSSKALYDKYFAMGVTMYGQMTAGSYCYIGPQGIVHGTTITVMNAGRKYLGSSDLAGKVFLTSGLGGMSGAQPKAGVIAGCICVVAEVDETALKKRLDQGWLMEYTNSIQDCIKRIREARKAKKAVSIGYLGNVVSLWEGLADDYHKTGELMVNLGSDQTSCHQAYTGGYIPVQLNIEEANKMIVEDSEKFKTIVHESLRRQIKAIDTLVTAGMYFWDYGNAFLLECHKAGVDMKMPNDPTGMRFKYPSYVQDIMGDIFSLGFGPFRWVCASGDPADLATTDQIAASTLKDITNGSVAPNAAQQYSDNIRWIEQAGAHKLVVGSQARILYSDQEGRVAIALAFNRAISEGRLKGPVILSRDHHDVSGTDSPFRETSNIYDGSAFTADMAIQNVIGDSFRGATWVSIHNGGGVGWGDVTNGGFGLVLDGTERKCMLASRMLLWDVGNGVARRCWSGNSLAIETVQRRMHKDDGLMITLPNQADDDVLNDALKNINLS